MAGILYIVSAPSGSGKSTLVAELMRLVPRLEFSVSYTTRAPRGSEKDGAAYHFVSRREFEEMIRRDAFLEHAEVFGNYYGTARRFLQEAAARGSDLLLDIDVQGAAQVKDRKPDAVGIFILPPSRRELEHRLRNRSHSEGKVQDDVIERRLQEARREIENSGRYDYILVNDRLEKSIDRLTAIVLAERVLHAKRPLAPEEEKLVQAASSCRRTESATTERLREVLASFTAAPSQT